MINKLVTNKHVCVHCRSHLARCLSPDSSPRRPPGHGAPSHGGHGLAVLAPHPMTPGGCVAVTRRSHLIQAAPRPHSHIEQTSAKAYNVSRTWTSCLPDTFLCWRPVLENGFGNIYILEYQKLQSALVDILNSNLQWVFSWRCVLPSRTVCACVYVKLPARL